MFPVTMCCVHLVMSLLAIMIFLSIAFRVRSTTSMPYGITSVLSLLTYEATDNRYQYTQPSDPCCRFEEAVGDYQCPDSKADTQYKAAAVTKEQGSGPFKAPEKDAGRC